MVHLAARKCRWGWRKSIANFGLCPPRTRPKYQQAIPDTGLMQLPAHAAQTAGVSRERGAFPTQVSQAKTTKRGHYVYEA
jgi:hypothetical protein